MSRTIVISGASGFLGRALAAALVERGDRVVPILRQVEPARRGVAVDVARSWVDRAALEQLGHVDAVVHLAGAGIADRRWTAARKAEILESRTALTELLASTIRSMEHPPDAFLTGSAIGYYGDTGSTETDEHGPAGGDFLAEVCRAWEQAATDLPVRTTFLRTGIVLGRGGGALAKQLPLFKAGLGGKLGRGRQYVSWIGLHDWVRAAMFLIDQPVAGPVNLTAPTPVTNAALTEELGRVLHRPTFAMVPPVALRIALGTELADTALLASQRVVPSALTHAGFTFDFADLRAALESELA